VCKFKFRKIRPLASVCLSGLIGLATFLTSHEAKAQACATGLGGAIGLSDLSGNPINTSTPVKVGDTIMISVLDIENVSTSYRASNVNAFVILPSNTSQPTISGINLPPGLACGGPGAGPAGIICPNDLKFGGATGTCLAFNNTYVVTFADINRPLTFSRTVNGLTTTCNSAGLAGHIQFEQAAVGVALNQQGAIAGNASVCQTIAVPVVFPCITVTKECVNPCTPIGQPIQIRGTVCNTGDSDLTNIQITNTPSGGAPVQVRPSQSSVLEPAATIRLATRRLEMRADRLQIRFQPLLPM
jgi:hypothetical protein